MNIVAMVLLGLFVGIVVGFVWLKYTVINILMSLHTEIPFGQWFTLSDTAKLGHNKFVTSLLMDSLWRRGKIEVRNLVTNESVAYEEFDSLNISLHEEEVCKKYEFKLTFHPRKRKSLKDKLTEFMSPWNGGEPALT